jgi:hypothetical protein
MSLRSRIGIIIAGIGLLVPLGALSASAAYASTGNVCTTTGVGWEICVKVTGSGLHVDTVSGWVHNSTGLRWTGLHLQERRGSTSLKSCPEFALDNGNNSPDCNWSPNSSEPAGSYCTTLWWQTQSGYVNEGSSCASVHK